MTTPEDQASAVLSQVVEIGSSPREDDLGAAVRRHVAGRSGSRGGGSPDPATVAALRTMATTAERAPGLAVVVDYNALEAKHGQHEALSIVAKLNDMLTERSTT